MKKFLILIALLSSSLNAQTKSKTIDVKKLSFTNIKIGPTIISNPERQILVTINDKTLTISNFKHLKTPETLKYEILSREVNNQQITDYVLKYKGEKLIASYEDDGYIKALFIRDNSGNMFGFLE